MKKVSEILGAKSFPFKCYDEKGNISYIEESDGSWRSFQYDADGNEVGRLFSSGFWAKREYVNGECVYYEDSDGYKEHYRKPYEIMDKVVRMRELTNELTELIKSL